MSIKKMTNYVTLLTTVLFFAGCAAKQEALPPAPPDIKSVQDFVKGKKLVAKSVGFYDNLTINEVNNVNWIDLEKVKDQTTKEAAVEEMDFSLQFINDTAVSVLRKGKKFSATYVVNDFTNEQFDEKPGIKLRVSYPDPEMSFGGQLAEVTYTYVVLGIDEKRMMLQTPRSVNRQKLISMLSE